MLQMFVRMQIAAVAECPNAFARVRGPSGRHTARAVRRAVPHPAAHPGSTVRYTVLYN